ncbi:MAG: orotate phosphoribosyltransferase [Candidatus Nealsonbacteria bacterium]|nr:orotate phosphoribosyltransferase [Candidatus Nealsonbacteria bacterium]
MDKKHWVEEKFEECGAILDGHFVLASERHSKTYLEKALVYVNPEIVSELCYQMAINVGLSSKVSVSNIECVVGPSLGGIILSQFTAYHLSSMFSKNVLSLFTEKDAAGKQVLKRGYQKLIAGKRVLIVDDILTTGESIKQVAQAVEQAGGIIVAVAVICNREDVTSAKLGYPLFCLWRTNIESWPAKECPLCQRGIPITM